MYLNEKKVFKKVRLLFFNCRRIWRELAFVIKAVNMKIWKCLIFNRKCLYLVIGDIIETVWNIL